MKTHTRWRYRLRPDRTVEWTSPTGHTYTTHPDRWLPPLEPPSWLDEPDPGADPGESTADWGADGADPPWPEACGPDTHPLLGVPGPDPADDDLEPEHDLGPDEDDLGPADDHEPGDDATTGNRARPTPGADLPGMASAPDPWAPAEPGTEDALEQDGDDWHLYATVFGR